MTACLIALRYDDIDSRLNLTHGVARRADQAHHSHPFFARHWHNPRRIAQSGGKHLHILLHNDIDLLLDHILLVRARCIAALTRRVCHDELIVEFCLFKTVLNHQFFDKGDMLRKIRLQLCADFRTSVTCAAGHLGGQDQIYTDRLVGQFSGLTDLIAQLFRRQPRPADNPHAAGLGDRRNQRRRRRQPPRSHTREQDRVFDVKQFAQRRAKDGAGHGYNSCSSCQSNEYRNLSRPLDKLAPIFAG